LLLSVCSFPFPFSTVLQPSLQPPEAVAILQQADGILQRSHCLLYTSTALSRMGGSPDSVAEGVTTAEDGLAACAKHMAHAAFLIVQEQRRHRAPAAAQAGAGADGINNNNNQAQAQAQAQQGAADQPAAAPPQPAAEGAAVAAAAAAAADAPAQAAQQQPQQAGAGVGVVATVDDIELLLEMVLRHRAGLPVPDHLREPLIAFCDAYFRERTFAPRGFPPLPPVMQGGQGGAAAPAGPPAAPEPADTASSAMTGLSAVH
jgi:hypothetical protein